MTAAEAIAAVQAAVATADLAAIYADLAPRFRVPSTQASVPLVGEVYPDLAAFAAAIAAEDTRAVGAVMSCLARRDGEAMLEPALALAVFVRSDPARPYAVDLRKTAALVLAHSTDERALAFLLTALDGKLGLEALARSVHPEVDARLRMSVEQSTFATFALRAWPTWTELQARSPAAQRAETATQRMPEGGARVTRAIEVLGMRGDRDAAPLLLRLFEGHPNRVIRTEAAHALHGIADPDASAVLEARWNDADPTIENIAIHAALLRDPAAAWARFAAQIVAVRAGTGDAVATRLVHLVLHQSHGGKTPRRVAPARDPLLREPRLVELAAELRHVPGLDEPARRVLGAIPLPDARVAIARHPRLTALAPAVLPARRDFLARYASGEYAVWDELVALGPAIAQHAELRVEAAAVAATLMRRVRANADALRATLREAGARLAAETAFDAEIHARVVALTGPLPLALDAFWRVVGSLALVPGDAERIDYGTCDLQTADGIALIALDPLEIEGTVETAEGLAQYAADVAASDVEIVGPFSLQFAPDYLHKQNISGGPPYTIQLPPPTPADAVDPRVLHERGRGRLVEYLRRGFRFGGFPLLEVAARPLEDISLNHRIAFQTVRGPWGAAADKLLARLRANLVEL